MWRLGMLVFFLLALAQLLGCHLSVYTVVRSAQVIKRCLCVCVGVCVMNRGDKSLYGRSVSVGTSASAWMCVVMWRAQPVVTLRTQSCFPFYTGTVCVSQNTCREDRVSVHIHTRRRVCVSTRACACPSLHVFLCISCCVSGCRDSRNLAEASLSVPLQHFKVGCSQILEYSYSSWSLFISPAVNG